MDRLDNYKLYVLMHEETQRRVDEFTEYAKELFRFQVEIERVKSEAMPIVAKMAGLNREIGPLVDLVRSLEKLPPSLMLDDGSDDVADFSMEIPQLFRELVQDLNEEDLPF